MNICKVCGKQTYGSVGAAGMKWQNICQSCKDEQDNALLAHATSISDAFRRVDTEIQRIIERG
jgi:hypothetical protein